MNLATLGGSLVREECTSLGSCKVDGNELNPGKRKGKIRQQLLLDANFEAPKRTLHVNVAAEACCNNFF